MLSKGCENVVNDGFTHSIESGCHWQQYCNLFTLLHNSLLITHSIYFSLRAKTSIRKKFLVKLTFKSLIDNVVDWPKYQVKTTCKIVFTFNSVLRAILTCFIGRLSIERYSHNKPPLFKTLLLIFLKQQTTSVQIALEYGSKCDLIFQLWLVKK